MPAEQSVSRPRGFHRIQTETACAANGGLPNRKPWLPTRMYGRVMAVPSTTQLYHEEIPFRYAFYPHLGVTLHARCALRFPPWPPLHAQYMGRVTVAAYTPVPLIRLFSGISPLVITLVVRAVVDSGHTSL